MCFLFYLNMTTEQQILKILKEENKPLKARDISEKFPLYFNESISKKEVNQVIYKELRNKVISKGFPSYRYALTNNEISLDSSNIVTDTIQSELNLTTPIVENTEPKLDEINPDSKEEKDAYKLIDEYIPLFYKYRGDLKDETLRLICLQNIEQIIEVIIKDNIELLELSDYLEKEMLIHKQIIGSERLQEFYKERTFNKTKIFKSNLDAKFLRVIEEYEEITSDLIKLERKPENVKSTFVKLIEELRIKSDNFFDIIIKEIIENNIQLTIIEDISSRSLFQKIENNNNIFDWISLKDENHKIENESYLEKLQEFKILCKKVWEDGVLDSKEQIEVDEKIKFLGISKEDAGRIFDEIKQDFKIDVTLQENEKSDEDVKITKLEAPKRPIEYFYKGASQEVFINQDVSLEKLILAICELDLNNHNQKILKKINRIIENDL